MKPCALTEAATTWFS